MKRLWPILLLIALVPVQAVLTSPILVPHSRFSNPNALVDDGASLPWM